VQGPIRGNMNHSSYTKEMPRILIADDDRQLVELVRATLDEAGFEVAVAHSGLAAAGLLEREDFDLVILDVLMPGMSGDALADLIHQLKPDLPVLLMTGDSGDQFVRGSDLPWLRKPFSERDLVEAVGALLKRS
jgi:DNA-binding response OmpR family regulator